MATWVLGDIHGQYKALQQVLERSRFDYDKDLLIFLGDIVDRGGAPFDCINELLKISNKILIMGNHDQNFYGYALTGIDGFRGGNGVEITIAKWKTLDVSSKQQAIQFFSMQVPYFIDGEQNIFTHGGFNPRMPVRSQDEETFAWDRNLWEEAVNYTGEKVSCRDAYKNIYIGHSPTLMWSQTTPMYRAGIYNLDTGAGFHGGRLTIMNLETQHWIQSDAVEVRRFGF